MANEVNQPQKLPLAVEANMLRLLCTYLLHDRAKETELRIAFEGLITERHAKFHTGVSDISWHDCGNEVCVSARLILDRAVSPSVELNQFAVELMKEFSINFRPVGDGKGGLLEIRAKLIENSKLQQSSATDPTRQTSGGLIIP